MSFIFCFSFPTERLVGAANSAHTQTLQTGRAQRYLLALWQNLIRFSGLLLAELWYLIGRHQQLLENYYKS